MKIGFWSLPIIAMAGAAQATPMISPDRGQIRYEIPELGWIALDCRSEVCELRGILNETEYVFSEDIISPALKIYPWRFHVLVDPLAEPSVSFAADMSVACPAEIIGRCFAGVSVLNGKIVEIEYFVESLGRSKIDPE